MSTAANIGKTSHIQIYTNCCLYFWIDMLIMEIKDTFLEVLHLPTRRQIH